MFEDQKYTTKADVYSFGVFFIIESYVIKIVIWEILTKELPYSHLTSASAIIKFVTVNNGRPDLTLIPDDCPPIVRWKYWFIL